MVHDPFYEMKVQALIVVEGIEAGVLFLRNNESGVPIFKITNKVVREKPNRFYS